MKECRGAPSGGRSKYSTKTFRELFLPCQSERIREAFKKPVGILL